ncbi:MAG TPA: sigma-70 family RNA polymerase sigma factor [Phycisphaerae bacterium]|nr:sigma-70 family RNA polymerase sigma factor [Phycisphaerae bacterium]
MTDWPAIVGRHESAVWQTAYRLLGNRADASDCFQETFLSALELSRRQKVRNWSALLMRVCTCRAMDQLRRRCRRADRHEDVADWAAVASPNPGPSEWALAAELSQRLRLALAALPGRQAEVFCMRCLNDLSYRAIARLLGIKTSAVGVLLHRARSRLRELLSPAVATEDVEVKP